MGQLECQHCGGTLSKARFHWRCDGCKKPELGWAIFTGSGSDSPFRIEPHIEADNDTDLFGDDDEAVLAALRLLQSDYRIPLPELYGFTRAELAEALSNSVHDVAYWCERNGAQREDAHESGACPECYGKVYPLQLGVTLIPYQCGRCEWRGHSPIWNPCVACGRKTKRSPSSATHHSCMHCEWAGPMPERAEDS